MTFAPALSREFRPYKPDPAPLLHICTTWDVQPNEVMMIGDSLKDDVSCSIHCFVGFCALKADVALHVPHKLINCLFSIEEFSGNK